MPRPRLFLRGALLAALCATSSAMPANGIFERQSTCAANHSRCPQTNLPDSFCCPNGYNCIPLAGDTTILCCQDGSTCNTIRPIQCDVSKQDPSKHPDSFVKTTALGGTLEKCGPTSCCPFGYSCTDGGLCRMNEDQSAAPSQSTPTPTSTTSIGVSSTPVTSTSTSTSTASPTESTDDSVSEPVLPEESGGGGSKSNTGLIAGVSVAIAVVGIAAIVFAFCWIKRRNRKKQEAEKLDFAKLQRSTSSFGNIIANPLTSRPYEISPPIATENSTFRSDFVRSPAASRKTSDSNRMSFAGSGQSMLRYSPSSLSNTDNGRSITHTTPTPPPRGRSANDNNPNGMKARLSSIAYGFRLPEVSTYKGTTGTSGSGGEQRPMAPPRTPPQRQPQPSYGGVVNNREPSSVSINVFADPYSLTPERTNNNNNGNYMKGAGEPGRYSQLTTFTQMIEEADLGPVARGQQTYVPRTPPNNDFLRPGGRF